MKQITVIGAGSWGTALSMVLADNGHGVRIWGNKAEQIHEINEKHTNETYLPEIQLPETIKGYGSLEEAMIGIDTVLLVVPTKAIRSVMQQLKNVVKQPITIIHASKGIEPGSFKRISEMIEEEMPKELVESIIVLSGPSHAEEVSLRHPTTVTAASYHLQAAEKTQKLFMNTNFRVYTNRDVLGVELGGALKNIIALGAGISDGLGYGDNAKAALISRGLTEITRLGCEMGANPLTFAGLTGVGDLIVTCTSVHSRNWRAGNLLGKGHNLEEVLENMGMVVEGVRTAEAAYHLAKKMNIEMPITNAIYNVLFNGKNAKEEVDVLMGRTGKGEVSN
ncbi:NAD(P)H-dependent glycerol-3-phosphate dehydrogenase [Bacillus wiedmannii]|uniref:Glycerol-3-phosphate dehydrogenase [NAD(P)+] n=1 Tax=Bacillus wiedmannii TaxID=1890302 RepID=A0A2B6F849_9BACI|nr:NAD(P)H-dependent glycerol-3-phosphate dehydrogenase [Bacillus wiedmannii]PEN47207.1 NAD(P)H-dependent glycerol-3-phosphate dehydrogenase [Bacillus wiedmannii]PEN65806.1 NAD(P)H-dependent glycerol-3-phosphate dehydrogenase [Bacillus wiedmannii]PEP49265.1 NAD(P)H-dependent glycerol-3-phosphate dehydrogenase [Bacillus wiedmannii]PEP76358.1 NAD(P)H-dependent glycerol-3-phosphate dehydrogenase [Bacillus wiedmannii]PGB94868.1 NAD(P)H-dependent glycerol-3-phosphate dehydrogenase [Bacillus wiedman